MTVLSIVIPSKDRQDTAENVIRAMLLDQSQDFEIIVHDNSSDDRLGQRIEALADSRVRYFHSTGTLNMHQNFDRAIALAEGQFVIGIGDDDAVLPSASISEIRKAIELGLEAIVPGLHTYSWPGVEHWHWGNYGGRFDPFRPTSSHEQGVHSTKAALARLYREGAASGLGILPRVYQGFVARSALEAMVRDHGTCFPGASPDMANAVALCSYVDRVLVSEEATVISGHSAKSGAGAGTAGKHHGDIERQTHIPASYLANWDSRIPRFWSGRTIYAQSAMNVAERTGLEPDRPFNFLRLYAALLVFEPRVYSSAIISTIKASPGFKPVVIMKTARAVLDFVLLRTKSYLQNRFHDPAKSASVYDSMQAVFVDLTAPRKS